MNRKQYLVALSVLFVGSLFGGVLVTMILRPGEALAAPEKARGAITRILRTRELQIVGPGNIIMAKLYVDEPGPGRLKAIDTYEPKQRGGLPMATGRTLIVLSLEDRQKNSKPCLIFYKPNGDTLQTIPSPAKWADRKPAKQNR